jgi:hypothetical protein
MKNENKRFAGIQYAGKNGVEDGTGEGMVCAQSAS